LTRLKTLAADRCTGGRCRDPSTHSPEVNMNSIKWLGAMTVVACFLAGSAGAQAPAAATDADRIQQRTLRVGDVDRKIAFYVPAELRRPPPLLIVLHGSGLTGDVMRSITAQGFDRLADREGFVVAYPTSRGYWADCRPTTLSSGVDDVAFLRSVVSMAAAEFKVDPARIYLFGYSGGGHMALRYAWATNDEVRAIAVVGSTLPPPDTLTCTMGGDSRVLLIHGTADPVVAYEGGPRASGGNLSAAETAATLARRLGVDEASPPRSLPTVLANDPTKVQWRAWEKQGRPMVALITIEGGGHTVPQPLRTFRADLGATSSFDSLAAAWSFFNAR
jgi:polyhydroxybutyrate depolymerase